MMNSLTLSVAKILDKGLESEPVKNAKTWGVSWVSPNAWSKWSDAVSTEKENK